MKRRKRKEGGLVWSSSQGRTCPGCERPVGDCECPPEDTTPASAGPVRVRHETKGRKGKGVTVVTGIPLGGAELNALAKRLKKRCGSGGTVKDGAIEIQGDHREALTELLREEGWTVR